MAEDKDIILLAEFCEVDGPRAIVTIPAGQESSFLQGNNNSHSLDDFLLQIMATDYQNFNGDKWKAESDVVCVRTHILPGVHGLLHYFTLQDPDARGWVRPACIAYVTHSVAKLKYLQQSILNLFELCARIIQQDNMLWIKGLGHETHGCMVYYIRCQSFLQSNLWLNVKDAKIIELLKSHDNDVSLPSSNGQSTRRWTLLCWRGFQMVCWYLLQFFRRSVLPLRDLVLQNFEQNIYELTSEWESFTDVSLAKTDAEYLSLLSDMAM